MDIFKKADTLNIGILKAVTPKILEFQKQSPQNIRIPQAVPPLNIGMSKSVMPKHWNFKISHTKYWNFKSSHPKYWNSVTVTLNIGIQ
jgi:hypothetical protein